MTAVTEATNPNTGAWLTNEELVKQMREAHDKGYNDALAGRGYRCSDDLDGDVKLAYGFGWKKGYDTIQSAQKDAA